MPENITQTGLVELIQWPESQGCIGCPVAALVDKPEIVGSSAYICLATDRNKHFCDNPEKL